MLNIQYYIIPTQYQFAKQTEQTKMRETPKPKIRLVIYHDLFNFYKKSNLILWSIRTFWYKGSAENKDK